MDMQNKLKIMSCIGFLLFSGTSYSKAQEWTWSYSKHLDADDWSRCTVQGFIACARMNVNQFTQLMFSWNAFRPKRGYFSFFVQVRDARTKRWGSWHHMVDWGNNVQRSYAGVAGRLSKYIHVRLEMQRGKLADSFRVKVVPHTGADVSLLKSFTVSVSNFQKFVPETSQDIQNQQLISTLIKDVPQISQIALQHKDSDRICSPTSCTMLTQFLTGSTLDAKAFADNVYDHGLKAYGSWPFNTAHAFEHTNGSIRMFPARLNSFIELYHQLRRGIPVVVSVRGRLPGAVKPFPHGHLITVVGYSARTRSVLCHDPAFKTHTETRVSYPLEAFLRSWEQSHRFVYWVEPVVTT